MDIEKNHKNQYKPLNQLGDCVKERTKSCEILLPHRIDKIRNCTRNLPIPKTEREYYRKFQQYH